jgi:L-ascorbate metabolism protein UlaG (beta-lactamase superfamily)
MIRALHRNFLVNHRLPLTSLSALLSALAVLVWFGFAEHGWGIGFTAAEGELVFRFETADGMLYRIESSHDLESWHPIRTIEGDGTTMDYSEPIDSKVGQKFFRVASLTAGTALTGDFLVTNSGDVLIHPIDHASFVMQWEGLTIYNDPVGGAAAFTDIPPADLILVGHRHGDHFSASTINAIRKDNVRIIAPQDVFNRMSATLQSRTTVLGNGESTTVLGLTVDAVPSYNANHPVGRDNGYIVTIGDRRIYMSGDTGDVAEMRALQDIDVAFLCMNIPFTMSIDHAASATRDFKPRVIYPYHYRNQDGSFADLERFRQLVGDEVGVEVRLRDWY